MGLANPGFFIKVAVTYPYQAFGHEVSNFRFLVAKICQVTGTDSTIPLLKWSNF